MTPETKAKLQAMAEAYRAATKDMYADTAFIAGAQAGYALGVKAERERCQGIAVAMTKAFGGAPLSELLGWQIAQAILNPPGDV